MAKDPKERPVSAARVRSLLLPWAKAAPATALVDPVAGVETLGPGPGLWESTSGDELPVAKSTEDDFAELEPEEESEASLAGGWKELRPAIKDPVGWLLVGIMVVSLGMIVLVVALWGL
jgi:hypothetical protein